MCGILFGQRKDNRSVVKSILKRYERQKTRGRQGFGYLAIHDDKVLTIGRSETEEGIEAQIKEEDCSTLLFHHRFPTSTENYEEATHPIVVKNKKLKSNYYVIHNGVISNHEEMKKKFEGMGFEYLTEKEIITTTKTKKTVTEVRESASNDSESFAIDLALYLENKQQAFDSVGTIAFICIETDKKDNVLRLHYGRNSGNPIIVERNNDVFFIKSVGQGYDLPEGQLITVDWKTGDVVENDVEIGETYKSVGFNNTNKYDNRNIHYTERTEKKKRGNPRNGLDFDDYDEDFLKEMFDGRGQGMGWGTPTIHQDDRDLNMEYEDYVTSPQYLRDLQEEEEELLTNQDIALQCISEEKSGQNRPSEIASYMLELKEINDKLKEVQTEIKAIEEFDAS